MEHQSVQLTLLVLFVASAFGFFIPLRNGAFRRAIRFASLLAAAFAVVGCMGSMQCIVWVGGYGQGEIEITFRDPDGRPVPGVRLRVENGQGREFFLYPVTDYLPDHVPTSDNDGRMVFHHVSHGVELSGRDCQVFFVYVPDRPHPVFNCRFLLGDREIACVPFWELDRWEQRWADAPKVKRLWKTPIWPTSELYSDSDDNSSDWNLRVLQYYDFDGMGRLSPEAVAAYHAATSGRAEEAAIAWLGERKRIEREEEFALVKRTIIVPNDSK